jgi:hypothetical protein
MHAPENRRPSFKRAKDYREGAGDGAVRVKRAAPRTIARRLARQRSDRATLAPTGGRRRAARRDRLRRQAHPHCSREEREARRGPCSTTAGRASGSGKQIRMGLGLEKRPGKKRGSHPNQGRPAALTAALINTRIESG